jgi:hypothetical protein
VWYDLPRLACERKQQCNKGNIKKINHFLGMMVALERGVDVSEVKGNSKKHFKANKRLAKGKRTLHLGDIHATLKSNHHTLLAACWRLAHLLALLGVNRPQGAYDGCS